MENKELEQKIKEIDLQFINHLNNETKQLGNKVILFSSIIILVLYYKSPTPEIDFTGIKFEIEKKMTVIILFFVNLYYLLQFVNAINIDKLLVKIPDDIYQIQNLLVEESEKAKRESDEISDRIKSENLTKEEVSSLLERVEELEKDNLGNIVKEWGRKINKALKFVTWNKNLNIYFPYICYSTSILVLLLALLKKYWV